MTIFRKILLCTLVAVSCGPQGSDSKVEIAGGAVADANTPQAINQSVVALATNAEFYTPKTNPSSSYCTGVIIAENLILTAAHCTEMLDRQMTVVVFGPNMKAALRDKANKVRQVIGFERHPGFPQYEDHREGYTIVRSPYTEGPDKWMAANPGAAPNDLAIVKFSGTLPQGYRPANLSSRNSKVPSELTLAGYGVVNVMNAPDTGTLRYAEKVPVNNSANEYIQRSFLPVAQTADVRWLSAGNSAKGACPGDSGGPAFTQEANTLAVIGILSLGESAKLEPTAALAYCLGNDPGKASTVGNLYTDIRTYRNWIIKASQRLQGQQSL